MHQFLLLTLIFSTFTSKASWLSCTINLLRHNSDLQKEINSSMSRAGKGYIIFKMDKVGISQRFRRKLITQARKNLEIDFKKGLGEVYYSVPDKKVLFIPEFPIEAKKFLYTYPPHKGVEIFKLDQMIREFNMKVYRYLENALSYDPEIETITTRVSEIRRTMLYGSDDVGVHVDGAEIGVIWSPYGKGTIVVDRKQGEIELKNDEILFFFGLEIEKGDAFFGTPHRSPIGPKRDERIFIRSSFDTVGWWKK